MLRYELYELEKSVGVLIQEFSTDTFNNDSKEIVEQVSYVKKLCADLKKKWTHELLSSAKDQVIKRYVQYHQAGIIQLSDKVSRQIPALNSPTEIKSIQLKYNRQINSELEDVLDFLRHQFYQYFDLDHKASIYCCDLLKFSISDPAPYLNDQNNLAIGRTIIDVIIISVHDLIDEGFFSGISYRQVEQCSNVLRLITRISQTNIDVNTDTLIRTLYQQNFNSLHFYNWFRDHVSGQIATITDKKEKQNLIKDQIQILAGIFVSPEKALQPEIPSTETYILGWLEEQTGSGSKRANIKPVTEQFPLNLSVPQFAMFVRIFQKTGCFPVENVAMITRFFTENFTTKKQPHISKKSFGRAFYSLDQSAAAVVREFLQKMLNYLNKTYFP